jgi:high-affinity iron transporter
MRLAGITTTIALVAAALLGGAVLARAASVEKGRALYEGHCASCHGLAGDGQGPQGTGMTPPPTAFTDAAAMAAKSDSDLQLPILQGKFGTAMPGYGTVLSPDDVESLLLYLRQLAR